MTGTLTCRGGVGFVLPHGRAAASSAAGRTRPTRRPGTWASRSRRARAFPRARARARRRPPRARRPRTERKPRLRVGTRATALAPSSGLRRAPAEPVPPDDRRRCARARAAGSPKFGREPAGSNHRTSQRRVCRVRCAAGAPSSAPPTAPPGVPLAALPHPIGWPPGLSPSQLTAAAQRGQLSWLTRLRGCSTPSSSGRPSLRRHLGRCRYFRIPRPRAGGLSAPEHARERCSAP